MPVINGVYTKDFPALGRAPIDTDIIPIAEVANQITYKTTLGEIFNAKVFGTTGRLSKFTSANTLGNSILNEIGNAIHLTNAGTSFASFGIINPGTPGEPGIDNDAYIGSTINNDFTIRVNNVEAARFDTALRFKIANIQNADTDTDKFLVSDGGVVKYRTGTELRADIGAGVGSVTSVGLSMPVAFEVANSPITSAGTLAVTAVGTASQYIRGDGQLATLPTGAGGGSAVNYYLNGSVASGVAGYQQMDNTAIIGAGTDFTLTGNGLIAQFLTDAGNPNRLQIPGGAWNLEMFFSVSSSGGNAKFYAEVLEYDGTTFTSIASGITTPEEITGGTSIDLYLTSLGVPETALLITDRLAIRVYIVDNSGGRTVTLHTEDNTLCQVTTTFAGGISALNGLTANTQYFAVGTSGTDFNISSTLDTHTFNIPSASATARGLITTGAQTIGGTKTFSVDAVVNGVNIGRGGGNVSSNTANGYLALSNNTTGVYNTANGFNALILNTTGQDNTANGFNALSKNITGSLNTANGSNALYNNTTGFYNTANGFNALYSNTTGSLNTANGFEAGTFANSGAFNQTSTTSIYLGVDTRSSASGNTNEIVIGAYGRGLGSNTTVLGNSSTVFGRFWGNLLVGDSSNTGQALQITGNAKITGTITNGTYTYTLPSANGTLALTSNITSAISGTTNYISKFTGANTIGNSQVFDNGTNVGIGNVTPNRKFIVQEAGTSTSGNVIGVRNDNSTSGAYINFIAGGSNAPSIGAKGNDITFTADGYGGTELLRVTGTGNLGLGVTPSAWGSSIAMQIGSKASIASVIDDLNLSNNAFYNGSNWIYLTNSVATNYYQSAGNHVWRNAPSGTAGNAITFTQAMTLGVNGILSLPSSGSLEIGYTSSPSLYKLDVNGTGRFAGGYLDITGAAYPYLSSIGNATTTGGGIRFYGSTTQYAEIYGEYESTNNGVLIFRTRKAGDITEALKLGPTGAATFSNLAGTGSRAVLADANGLLSAPVSDKSVKQNIESIGYGLNEIVKMNPVWFDFVDGYKNFGEGRQNGNIAQEMEAIIPEAVFTTPSTGKMGINYDQLHAVYIKAIQELKAEIDLLKNK